MKYSDKTTPQLIKTLTKYFNEFIRLRDTDDNGVGRCISSGKFLKIPSKQAQAGHFYPAGSYPRLRFNEDNVHLQSLQDNYFKHGNLNEYRQNLLDKIGVERLHKLDAISLDRTPYKWDRFDLTEQIKVYKAKVKELRKEKMF